MSEALPIGDFTFLSEDEVASFDLDATTKSDHFGYILAVDLKYPEHLHDSHPDYPLAVKITKELLSSYFFSLTNNHVTSEKLSQNLYNKTNYVVHYENLRLYLKHGLQLVKKSPSYFKIQTECLDKALHRLQYREETCRKILIFTGALQKSE